MKTTFEELKAELLLKAKNNNKTHFTQPIFLHTKKTPS